MKRTIACGVAFAACLAFASAAGAKQYEDYSPGKGVWGVTAIEVDPNHVDEYLTGLRKSQVPGLEVMKKHGLIDEYRFAVRSGYTKGQPNVVIEVHYTSFAVLEPDKARDEMIEKEILAGFGEEEGKAAVAGYEKYRQFLDDSLWTEMIIAK